MAHNYPESPSASEKALVSQCIELFRDTITCPTCEGHFTELLISYKSIYPYYLDSRTEFILFSYRAHNTVNRRLDKPIYHRVEECEEVYTKNITSRPAAEYRVAYLNHIQRYWASMRDMTGIAKLRKVLEMRNIEIQYWAPRETPPGNLTNISVSPIPEKLASPSQSLQFGRPPSAAVSFTGGRLRFRR